MKKSLALLLSLMLIVGIVSVPVSADAVGVVTKSICFMDYSEINYDAPEDTYPWNHYVVQQIDDGETEYGEFDNVQYDKDTNTLTLNNFKNEEGHYYKLSIVGMGNISVHINGECELANAEFIRSNVRFDGTGKLSINAPTTYVDDNGEEKQSYMAGVSVRISGGTLTIGSGVTVSIKNTPEADKYQDLDIKLIKFEFLNSDTVISDVFDYDGTVSEEPDWISGTHDENYKYFSLNNDAITFLSDTNPSVIFSSDTNAHEHEEQPEIPEDNPNEGIAPSELKVKEYTYDDDNRDYEKGDGYIRADDAADEEYGGAEIVNLFHSTAVTPYKGMDYDLETNTLTLNNVQGDAIVVQCDNMLHLKINVVGNNVIKCFGFWGVYPSFIGTGTLTVNEPINAASSYGAYRKGLFPMTVSDTVTLTLKGNEDGCGSFSAYSLTDSFDTANIISYGGKVSEPLNWELTGQSGGPTKEWASLSGVRARTMFKATEILKKVGKEGENNYYIKSISHVGNEPYTYHHISQLVEKDGYWFEKDDGNNYWNKDYLFENYTAEEVNSMPASLVNSQGYATAYLSTQFDYGQAYTKDNKVFVINGDGRYRNLIVNPVVPRESEFDNDYAPTVMMRVVKLFDDEDVCLVRFEEEFDYNDTMNYEATAEFMKTKGYEKLMVDMTYPYEYYYALKNNSVTFSPSNDVTEPTGATQPTSATQATEPTGATQPSVTQATEPAATQPAQIVSAKKAQPMKVTAKAKTVKRKKKDQTISVVTVKKAKGKVTYKLVKGASKLKLNTKTGKITIKKGIKKGIYKISIKVTAKGNDAYESGTKTVTVKIKVK